MACTSPKKCYGPDRSDRSGSYGPAGWIESRLQGRLHRRVGLSRGLRKKMEGFLRSPGHAHTKPFQLVLIIPPVHCSNALEVEDPFVPALVSVECLWEHHRPRDTESAGSCNAFFSTVTSMIHRFCHADYATCNLV